MAWFTLALMLGILALIFAFRCFNTVENVFQCLESQRDSLVKILQFLLAVPELPLHAAGKRGGGNM